MDVEYEDIPRNGDERSTLLAFLEWQRRTLARKCAGLELDQLRIRSVEPSTLSLLGLVRHMADVERGWFRSPAAGPGGSPPIRAELPIRGSPRTAGWSPGQAGATAVPRGTWPAQ